MPSGAGCSWPGSSPEPAPGCGLRRPRSRRAPAIRCRSFCSPARWSASAPRKAAAARAGTACAGSAGFRCARSLRRSRSSSPEWRACSSYGTCSESRHDARSGEKRERARGGPAVRAGPCDLPDGEPEEGARFSGCRRQLGPEPRARSRRRSGRGDACVSLRAEAQAADIRRRIPPPQDDQGGPAAPRRLGDIRSRLGNRRLLPGPRHRRIVRGERRGPGVRRRVSVRLLPVPALRRAARLERNVVVHVVELARRLLAGFALAGNSGFLGLVAALARARIARALPAAEHLHAVGDDLGGGALLPFLVLPLARAQGPFDIDLRPLLQVLARDLREPVEEHHAVPLGALLLLAARLVLPGVGGRDRDVGDRAPFRVVARLGVPPQIAYDNDLIDRCHQLSPSLISLTARSSNDSGYTFSRAMPCSGTITASRTPRERTSRSRRPVGSSRGDTRYARSTVSPGTRIPEATPSHNAITANPNTKTAGSAKFLASQPPAAPPTNSPKAWVVLYTPSAVPREAGGATRDTRDGRLASRMLKATKKASSRAIAMAKFV